MFRDYFALGILSFFAIVLFYSVIAIGRVDELRLPFPLTA